MQEATDHDHLGWVHEHLDLIWRVSRRAREASAQLDGALTAGQSSAPDTNIGMCLKYEVKAGLLDELEELLVAVRPGGLAVAPGFEQLADRLWNAHHLITANFRAISRASYAESKVVEQARFAL